MTSKTPIKCMGDSEQHDSQTASDLTASPSKRSGAENSPTKSKNKRKNDARKRNANQKKQMANSDQSERQSQQPITPTSSHPPVPPPPATHKLQQEPKEREYKELKELKESIKSQSFQMQSLVEQIKQQIHKTKELETALLNTTRALQQELTLRTRLEAENDSLNQTISRLKIQLSAHEKNKANNDELMRVLTATLMERETEVSILKLKLTRMQTNPSSTLALNSASNASLAKNDPCQVYASTGRSNSEFDRNSYIRSSMIAEAASIRASTSQLRSNDRDASVWATVPEELTPSKRPQMLDRSFQSIYGDPHYNPYGNISSTPSNHASTPIVRDRRYKTLPRSMKSPSQDCPEKKNGEKGNIFNNYSANTDPNPKEQSHCQVTNLDDSNSTSQSSGNKTMNSSNYNDNKQQTSIRDIGPPQRNVENIAQSQENAIDTSHYSSISKTNIGSKTEVDRAIALGTSDGPPILPIRTPTTPVKFSNGLKKIFDKFRRSDSQGKSDSTDFTSTPPTTPFKRGANRSTMVGTPVRQAMNFQTDKPFAEWNTDMLVDWLTMIGLSMYSGQCRRWVKCGAHIMNATPAEVDKGLGITNHLHRKKLRLAISELNGDCDKITKAAARLDYLWVARWLDDIGLPQYKEAFINARVDGRVLNYLTVEDLVSLGVKSVLHHASIRCGIRVLRLINFDLQQLERRATAEEVEKMSSMRQQMNNLSLEQTMEANICFASGKGTVRSLWTCHRVMEWLRLIDFAEFAPNLRGSGVHGGLIIYEDGFTIDTMCSLLSIPIGRTLLRRHLSTFFEDLIGKDLAERKRSSQQLNPLAEIKTLKKSPLWFSPRKKVGHDGMDEYLCPMYPVEPRIIRNPEESPHLSKIPESINV